MNVAILSESDYDEGAIGLIAQKLSPQKLSIISHNIKMPSRGWTAAMAVLGPVYLRLHYDPSAHGLVCVLDSDDTTPHTLEHETKNFTVLGCRYCEMRRKLDALQKSAASVAHRTFPLRIAIGLAVPAIEAWYQCGVDVHSTEAHFQRLDVKQLYHERKRLKAATYGSVGAQGTVLADRSLQHAQRLCDDIAQIKRLFPCGFGMLARDILLW
jgi:hypothetical protein